MQQSVRIALCFSCFFLFAGPGLLMGQAPASIDLDVVHPTGYREPTPEEEAAFAKVSRRVTKRQHPEKTLPATHYSLEHLPAVGLQLLGTCTTWGIVYYCHGSERARALGWTRPGTPDKLSSTGLPFRFIGDVEAGSSVQGNVSFLVEHGTCAWPTFPETYDLFQRMPGEDAWREALGRRVVGSTEIYGLDVLKEHLVSGRVAATVVPVSANFDAYSYGNLVNIWGGVDNDVIYSFNGPLRAPAHIVTAVGYDETRAYFDGTTMRHGAVLMVNSWGTDWGVQAPGAEEPGGFFWVPEEFAASLPYYAVDLEWPPHVATDLAWVEFRHPRLAEIGMSVYVGNSSRPEYYRRFYGSSGESPYTGTVLIDLTGSISGRIQTLSLQPFDAYIPVLGPDHFTGFVDRFAVELADGTVFSAEGLPVQTVEMDPPTLPRQWIVATRMKQKECELPRTWLRSMDVGDIDNDGDIDALISGRILLNDGAGNLVPHMQQLMEGDISCVGLSDYDRDGWLDAFVFGVTSDGKWRIRLYRNSGGLLLDDPQPFELAFNKAQAKWAAYPVIVWADVDSDGDSDLVSSIGVFLNNGRGGFAQSQGVYPDLPRAFDRIVDFDGDGLMDWGTYRNDGAGGFEEMYLSGGENKLTYYDSIAWGDFDSDGMLDLGVSGTEKIEVSSNSFKFERVTRIYRNNGNSFVMTGSSHFGLENCTMRWADVTNDGLLDLVLNGTRQYPIGPSLVQHVSEIIVLRQRPDGTFAECGYPLKGLGEGPLSVADLDADGDLDILYGGRHAPPESPSFVWETLRAENENADLDKGGKPNVRPMAPPWQNASPDTAKGRVFLTWGAGSDAETPKKGLSYRLRVGTRPGAGNIVSPVGMPKLDPHAASDGALYRRLGNLAAGTYYWSVQTVDAGLAVSDWTAEQSFRLDSSPITPFADANRDGLFDSSDVEEIRQMVSGAVAVNMSGDIDGNGVVDAGDVDAGVVELLRVISGLPAGTFMIGTAGGVVEGDGVTLTIPPGAFAETRAIRTVRLTQTGFADPAALPLAFEIEGLPMNHERPIEVAIDNSTWKIAGPQIVIGTAGFARSRAGVYTGWMPAKTIEWPDGRITFEIPVVDKVSMRDVREAMSSLPEHRRALVQRAADDYKLTVGVLSGYATLTTPHFSIGFPSVYAGDQIERLGDAFEAAYARFRSSDLAFSYARRTKWPVSVCVYNMGTLDGAAYNSVWGVNHGYIEINQNILGNADLTKATAGHEFFHIVQGFYDPRNRISAASSGGPQYWMDEAMSTWSEQLFVASPSQWIPGTWSQNGNETYSSGWVPASGATNSTIAEHGYGMASMIRYLTDRYGQSLPSKVYRNLQGGDDPVVSIRKAVDDVLLLWYRDYCEKLILGDTYPVDDSWVMAQVEDQRTFEVDADQWPMVFLPQMDDLSAALFKVTRRNLQYMGLPDDCSLAIYMAGDQYTDMSLLSYKSGDGPKLLERLYSEDGISIHIVPDFKRRLESKEVFFPLVVNREDDKPYSSVTPVRLEMSVVRTGEQPLEPIIATGDYGGVRIPTVTMEQGTIDVVLAEEIEKLPFDLIGTLLLCQTWAEPPAVFHIKAPVVLSNQTYTGSDGTVYTAGGVSYYEMSMTDTDGNDFGTFQSFDGSFEIPVPEFGKHIFASIYVHYDITETPSKGQEKWTRSWYQHYLGIRLDSFVNY